MMGWQWHQLYHMQIIRILLQTYNHATTSPLSFYRLDALPAAQPTASRHWRHKNRNKIKAPTQGHLDKTNGECEFDINKKIKSSNKLYWMIQKWCL